MILKALKKAVLCGFVLSPVTQAATPIGHFQSLDGEGAAEIISYDVSTQCLVVANAEANAVDFIDASDPTNLYLKNSTTMANGINSVAVKNGMIAVAVEGATKQDNGQIIVLNSFGTQIAQFPAGALPDMVTFSPDGNFILAANEGEPDEGDENTGLGFDPEGTVTVVDISNGLNAAVTTQINFNAFDNKIEELRNAGVKLYTPNASVSQDLEPEYITVSPDSKTAFVGCQENNAIVVIDLENLEIKEIQPLGVKDHSKDLPVIINNPFPKMPVLGKSPAGQKIRLGGFSGLHFEKQLPNGKLIFLAHPDRGPNGEPTDANNDGVKDRPFPLPDFQPSIYRISLNPKNGKVKLLNRTRLWRTKTFRFFCWTFKFTLPMTGLPNMQAGDAGSAYTDETAVDLFGRSLRNDPYGADLEGIAIADDGSYWMCDEYRPAIYHFKKNGMLIKRYVPAGSAAANGKPAGYYGSEDLPEVYASRRKNRGFEAIAIENGKVFAFMLANAWPYPFSITIQMMMIGWR